MPAAWRTASHPDSINPTIYGLIAQHAAVKPDAVDLAKKDPCLSLRCSGPGQVTLLSDEKTRRAEQWVCFGVPQRIE